MIEAKSLTKRFGRHYAVRGVSFAVSRGEVLGFLGPNGAGKSTTMRMITGFIPPTSGTALVGGNDILTAPVAARKLMGYLPESAPVYPDMTVEGFLGFIAEVRGFGGPERRRRVAETLDRCFLSEVRHQAIQTLSKGYRQRVCFAQGILHDPDYLIMDEPTDGLDPNQKHEVRNMIRTMAERKTILLSTHILEEVEAVCTRVLIINAGEIVADDTPVGLKERSSSYGAVRMRLMRCDGPVEPGLFDALETLPGVRAVQRREENGAVLVHLVPTAPGAIAIDSVSACLRERNTGVSDFLVDSGRLDEVFRDLTLSRGKGGDDA